MPTLPVTISNSESREYSITRLTKDNLADVARLRAEVYGTSTALDYFLKKYDTAYTGVENVGFIAYDKVNLPIAYHGVIPCFIQFGNEIILAAQAVDAMTHPEHRNKGMFVKLSNMTSDLCREIGIRLLFGFPNQNSHPAMVNHLGWIEAEKMNRFTIRVSKIWGIGFFQDTKQNREKVLNQLLSSKEGISNSVIADGYAGVYRNEAYMRYKTFMNNCVIKIGSGYLWVKIGKELIIGDILLEGNSDKDFFEEVKTLAKKLGISKIAFQVCNNCSLHNLFASRYKAIPSFPVLFKDFGSRLPLAKIKFTFADIDIF